jgi:hypothetical protein
MGYGTEMDETQKVLQQAMQDLTAAGGWQIHDGGDYWLEMQHDSGVTVRLEV